MNIFSQFVCTILVHKGILHFTIYILLPEQMPSTKTVSDLKRFSEKANMWKLQKETTEDSIDKSKYQHDRINVKSRECS